MIFGFGKEEINYSRLISQCHAGYWTFEKHLKEAWNLDNSLPSFEDNEEIILATLRAFVSGMFNYLLQENEKNEFMTMNEIANYKIYLESENASYKEQDSYNKWLDEIDKVLVESSKGHPLKSFLTGLLRLVKVPEESIENKVELMSTKFDEDLMQGFAMATQNFLKDKKIVGDSEDKELADWYMNINTTERMLK